MMIENDRLRRRGVPKFELPDGNFEKQAVFFYKSRM
jgi:hypothetical protein